MKLADHFIDEKGWLFHKDDRLGREYGDGSHHYGIYMICRFIMEPENRKLLTLKFWQNYITLWEDKSEPIRCPSGSGFWTKKGTMSRDNFLPLVLFLSISGNKKELLRISWLLIKRFGFMWNTKHIWEDTGWKVPDWCGFSMIGFILKGLLGKYHSIFRIGIIFDLEHLVNSFLRIVIPIFNPDSVSNDLTHAIKIFCGSFFPNFSNGLAGSLYFLFRPNSPEWAFRHYFRHENAPPIDKLMCEVSKCYRADFLNTHLS